MLRTTRVDVSNSSAVESGVFGWVLLGDGRDLTDAEPLCPKAF